MLLQDLMVALVAPESHVFDSVENSGRNQAFLECHVSKSLDLTQAVPTTGTSRTFCLQKVFPQPKTCSLSFSPAAQH